MEAVVPQLKFPQRLPSFTCFAIDVMVHALCASLILFCVLIQEEEEEKEKGVVRKGCSRRRGKGALPPRIHSNTQGGYVECGKRAIHK